MSRHHDRKYRTAWWRQRRRAVFERDNYACVACGKRSRLECDHIVAVADGGSDDLANLRTLCRTCHMNRNRDDNKTYTVAGQDEWEAFVA